MFWSTSTGYHGTQYRIIRGLARDHRNLCVVGDDDQSIYGWRGAEVRHILNFRNDWPDAKVVRLEDNYRSTAAILHTANQLILFNQQRHDKTLRAARPNGLPPRVWTLPDETTEAREVVPRDRPPSGGSPRSRTARLCHSLSDQRTAAHFRNELRRARLPYLLTGSQSFFDRKEVRDLLAYLRWIVTPTDEVSLLRIINTPPRGLGAKSIEQLMDAAVRAGKPIWNACENPAVVGSLPPNAQAGVAKLRELHGRMHQSLTGDFDLAALVRRMIDDLRYDDEISRLYPDPDEQTTRRNSIEELVNAIAQYAAEDSHPTLEGFLSEVAIVAANLVRQKKNRNRETPSR